jgi:thiosulfate reductase / polysulfide reductase chain A
MAFSRRNFLKYAAMSAGGTLVADTPFFSASARAEAEGGNVRYVPTTCEMCFWRCGVVAKVVDGEVVKLEGNPLHPQSKGKLCARGQAGIGHLYDKDRLKRPMIREGERGEGKYREVSWDEALDYIAKKLKEISGYDANAPEGEKFKTPEYVAMLSHGPSGDHFSNLLWAMGSDNIAFPSFSQCLGPRNIAWDLTFGSRPTGSCELVDFPNSKVIVLLGMHLGENMHNSQVQEFVEGMSKGAKIICVDPRFSTAASKAYMWLPIKPATDLALLLTWINIIIQEGLYDKEYVKKYTNGFDELTEAVAAYTPSWAAQETDLPEEQIVEAARILGRYAPNVVIHPGRHSAWHGNDTQRSRAMAILTGILGAWGRSGGVWMLPKVKFPGFNDGRPASPKAKKSAVKGEYYFTEALTQKIRRAIRTGEPYPIKALFMCGADLLRCLPSPELTREAINKLELLVAIDIMPGESVMLADVILPECTYLERHEGLISVETRELGAGIRQPVIEPMYDTKPAWWMGRELCKRMDLEQYALKDTWEARMQRQAAAWKIDYKKLADEGYVSVPNSSAPYITPENQPVFKTISGKIELYSEELEDEGYDPVPQYKALSQPEKGTYRLIYGRSPVHTFSRTINNQWLWELQKENELWLNIKEARLLGIKNGQMVRLENQDKVQSPPVRVRATERIRRDCVYVIHGFGHNAPGLSRAHKRGICDQELISKYKEDPICGATGMRVNFVKILKEA